MVDNRTIKILQEAAKKYKENLLNKDFLIISKLDSKYNSVECRFTAENFRHLTGAKWNSKLNNADNAKEVQSASHFLYDLVDDRFNPNSHYEFNGVAKQKLKVLPYAVEFFKHARYCGSFNGMSFALVCNYIIGNRSFILCLDKEDDNKNLLFPRSLLDKNARDLITDHEAEIAIFRKGISDKSYKECVYVSDSVKEPLSKLPLPKTIKGKIKPYLSEVK